MFRACAAKNTLNSACFMVGVPHDSRVPACGSVIVKGTPMQVQYTTCVSSQASGVLPLQTCTCRFSPIGRIIMSVVDVVGRPRGPDEAIQGQNKISERYESCESSII